MRQISPTKAVNSTDEFQAGVLKITGISQLSLNRSISSTLVSCTVWCNLSTLSIFKFGTIGDTVSKTWGTVRNDKDGNQVEFTTTNRTACKRTSLYSSRIVDCRQEGWYPEKKLKSRQDEMINRSLTFGLLPSKDIWDPEGSVPACSCWRMS